MTAFLLRAVFAAAVFAAGLAPVAWADTAAELQAKIERTQDQFDSTLGEYNNALQTISRRRGEVETAETVLRSRTEEMEAALEKLRNVQEFIRERTDVSDEKEKAAYAAARATHDQARRLLKEKTAGLAKAKGDATDLLAALKGYQSELKNFGLQVAGIRFRKLQESLSQESAVVARGEFGCEDVTVRECRNGALELAKRSAVEQGSAVLLESETVLEDLWVFIGSEAVAEDRQVMKERIRSHVTGILVSHRILDNGWVGEASYFYEIEAVVKGQVSEEFFRIAGIEDLPALPEPDQVVGNVRAEAVSEQAHVAPLGTDPESEVLRLREQIGKERNRIEALRTKDLEHLDEAYRAGLAAIAPKDMFESEAEYRARTFGRRAESRWNERGQRVRSIASTTRHSAKTWNHWSNGRKHC